MGDINGISAEIIAKLLGSKQDLNFIPVVYGNYSVFQQWKELLAKLSNYNNNYWNFFFEKVSQGKIIFKNFGNKIQIKPATETALSGQVSFECLKNAILDSIEGRTQALVTAPISKQALALANIPYKGHSPLLAELCQTKEYTMAFSCPDYWLLLVTDHLPLNQVAKNLSSQQILSKIKVAHNHLIRLAKKNCKIAVCGLNPHAGEEGILGKEDATIIAPAITQAKKLKIAVSGPYPADSLFYRARQKEFSFILAMYHDQGLVGLKSCYFENSAQVTLGLNIIRTSVAHGTAFPIAGQGIAKTSSLAYAIKTAQELLMLKK